MKPVQYRSCCIYSHRTMRLAGADNVPIWSEKSGDSKRRSPDLRLPHLRRRTQRGYGRGPQRSRGRGCPCHLLHQQRQPLRPETRESGEEREKVTPEDLHHTCIMLLILTFQLMKIELQVSLVIRGSNVLSFLTRKLSFWTNFEMWISEFAYKKSANNEGHPYCQTRYNEFTAITNKK